MLTSDAYFSTPNGAKYLQQLCKHFAHKVDVEYNDTEARAALPPGPAQLRTDAQGLSVTVSAQDEQGLKVAQYIIDDHLKRFAFRENFTQMAWS